MINWEQSRTITDWYIWILAQFRDDWLKRGGGLPYISDDFVNVRSSHFLSFPSITGGCQICLVINFLIDPQLVGLIIFLSNPNLVELI